MLCATLRQQLVCKGVGVGRVNQEDGEGEGQQARTSQRGKEATANGL